MTTTTTPSPWRSGGPVLGVWLSSGSPAIAQLVDHAGYDFVGWDCQHSPLDEAAVAEILRGSRMPRAATMVRVSKLDGALIGKLADAGADGILVPLVSTAGEAQAAVEACRYPPQGTRSFGPMRPEMRGLTEEQLADQVSCFVLAETREAVDNIDAICATPHLAGVFVGPKDLAISLGTTDRDELHQHMRDIGAACRRHGVLFGLAAANGADARSWAEEGAQVMTLGSDVIIAAAALASEVDTAREGGTAPA